MSVKQARKAERRKDRRNNEEQDMPEVNLYGHITNSCIQRDHPNFDEDQTVRLLSELTNELGQEVHYSLCSVLAHLLAHTRTQSKTFAYQAVDTIWQRIKTNVKEIFCAYQGEFSGFMPLPNCFELFGLDFIVDEDLNPIILEVKQSFPALVFGFFCLLLTFSYFLRSTVVLT